MTPLYLKTVLHGNFQSSMISWQQSVEIFSHRILCVYNSLTSLQII